MASSVPVIGDGRYELIEPLSSGGMGQVWRGFDTVLDREIAVKLIRPDVISTAEQAEEFAKRFRREARITARIRHHGVPQVHDALLEPSFEQVYLVMELVHGTPLHAFIDPARPLPIGWVAAVTAQICTVLSHAHALPVVHRDLKPDNVMLCPDGTVKLLDFGIAAILRSDVSRITSTGTPIGTNHYMAPEQILGGQVAPYTDLYALGCLLHELLSGQHVFDGGNEFELWQQHLSSPPPPLRSIRSDVPEPMEALVLHLLAKAPEQRPADAYEVYERLLPSLPGPGEPPAGEARAAPHGNGPPLPDPTLLYRRPNPPLPRAAAAPAGPIAAAFGALYRIDRPMPHVGRWALIIAIGAIAVLELGFGLVSSAGVTSSTSNDLQGAIPQNLHLDHASPIAPAAWLPAGATLVDDYVETSDGIGHASSYFLAVPPDQASQAPMPLTGILAGWHDLRFEAWHAYPNWEPTSLIGVDTSYSSPFLIEPAVVHGDTLDAGFNFEKLRDGRDWWLVVTGVGPDGIRYRLGDGHNGWTPFNGSVWEWITAPQ